jgi:hypothetical protein
MKGGAALAVLALTASACSVQLPPRDRVIGIAPAKGGVVVSIASGRGSLTQWDLDDGARILSAAKASTPAPPRTEDCDNSACYRLVEPYRVEESADGGISYGLSYEVSAANLAALSRDLGGTPTLNGVVVKPVAGGHVVFVAAGLDGVLYRARDGQWRRMGVPRGGEGYYWEPTAPLASEPAPPDRGPYVGLVVFAILAVVGVIAMAVRGALRSRRMVVVVGLAVLSGLLSWAAAYFPDVGMFPGVLYAAATIALILTLALATIVLLAWRTRAPVTGNRVVRP